MSKLVSKVVATGAAVSMLTLPGLTPVIAAPSLGEGQPSSTTSSPAGDSQSAQTDPAADDKSTPNDESTPTDKSTPTDASAQAAAEGTQVQLLNITDFHGRISDAGAKVASVVEEQRAAFDSKGATGMLSAGDNIGASPYNSSSAKDKPTLDVLNAIGVQASAVGNHEFDRGISDLTGRVSDTADFPYLGANVYDKGSKEDVVDGLDEYTMVDVDGVKVAVIGVVTKETATLVSPEGISEIEFGDPTDAVNRVADEIENLPADEQPDMTVVEAHLGASSTESLEDAKASNAEFKKLVTTADASIDVLFTGHTHLPYSFEAPVPGDTDRTRPVLEAGNYGTHVGQVQLTSDGEGNWTTDEQQLISTDEADFESDVVTEVEKIIAEADEAAKVPGSVVHGKITEDISRAFSGGNENRGGESTLGNLVADALKDGVQDSQLEAADFGITNPGGLRTDLKCDHIYNDEEKCEVTAAELNEVLPFANDHGVVTMKGADVIGLFEEQWQPDGARNSFLHLGISDELDVVYDSDVKDGKHVKSVKVDGEAIDKDKDYRVATLSFLATGGDNFTSFAKGSFEQSGLTDFDTWVNYFENKTKKGESVAPDKNERQADAAKDVIDNGKLTAKLTGPKNIKPGSSADFVLQTNAKSEVAGPIDVTVDLPKGYTAEVAPKSASQSASAKASEAKGSEAKASEVKATESDAPEGKASANAAKTISLESIPAGESETVVKVTAPEDASGEVTVALSLQANADGPWWDDNPLPLAHKFKATAAVSDDANASAGDDGAADGGNADGGDSTAGGNADGGDNAAGGSDGSSSADGADANASSDGGSADGTGANADGSKDGGDLPRTGFETFNIVAAALALIVAGGTAVTVVRRRKINS